MIMEKLRKYSKLYLWIVVGGFVGWIFFDLGADIVGKRIRKPWERGIIAEVNKKPVPYDYYRARLEMVIKDSTRAKGGRELTDREMAAIERQVWQSIMTDFGWQEIKKERKFKLSDEAIVELMKLSPPPEILQSKEFQNEQGQFDINKYLQALYDPRNLPFFKQYEMRLREEIPKMVTQVDLYASVPVSEEDLWEEFVKQETKIKTEYIGLVLRKMPDSVINYTEEMVKKYYDEHMEKFRSPEKANFAFVLIRKLPSREDTLEAKDRLLTALEEIKEGTPFEEAVKYYSEDETTKETNGDIGWFKKDTPPKVFYEIAKRMKKGEISKPILTSKGWHLIKVVDKKKGSVKLRHILIRIRTGIETKERLREKAEHLLNMAKEIGLKAAADSLGVEYRETGEFSLRSGFIPFIGPDRELVDFIREHEVGALTNVARRPDYYLVGQILEKKPSEIPPFEEVKSWVEAQLKKELKKKLADSLINSAYNEIISGKSFKEVADRYKKYSMFYKLSDYFTMEKALPEVGYKTEFHGIAFSLKPGEISKPFFAGRGYYVLKVLDRKEPTKEEFEKKKAALIQRVKIRYYNALYTGFTIELTKNLKIKDYRDYLLY